MSESNKLLQTTLRKEDLDYLINRCNAFKAIFNEQNTALHNEYRQELNQVKKKYDSRVNDIRKIKSEAESQLSVLRDRLQHYFSSAESHLRKQSVPVPNRRLSSSRTTFSNTNALTIAEQRLDWASKIHNDLKSKLVPYQYDGPIWAISIIGGLILGGLGGVKVGGDAGVLVFVIVFVLILGAGFALSQFIKKNVIDNIQSLYEEFIEQKEICESAIDAQAKILNQNLQQGESNSLRKFNDSKNEIKEEFEGKINETVEETIKSYKQFLANRQDLISKGAYSVIDFKSPSWDVWQPIFRSEMEEVCIPSVAFGTFSTATSKLDDWILLPAESANYEFDLPSVISLQTGKGLLFNVSTRHKPKVISAVQAIMLRLLATFPPGMVRFTMLDPIGLGQNVAAYIPLGRYDDKLITSRAWSEPKHIEKELEQLTLHLQDFIQMRLRNEHKSIEEFNQKSKVPEPYHFLIVFDFPSNFGNEAIRRLISIAENGARCGVYPIVVVDRDLYSKNTPYNFNLNSLSKHLEVVNESDGHFIWERDDVKDWTLSLESLNLEQEKELIDTIIAKVGESAVSAMKVEVPFEELLNDKGLTADNLWKEGNKTIKSVTIPLGPQNVEENQELVLGEGTSHHAIIIGKTGSGKTNLMDVIITALALKYSPEEIQFYLIDLKKGVGFKPYADARLPHAKVIAIDSEREFALSVLRGLVAEMDRRGDIFRNQSVDSVKSYREKTNDTEEKMPRILLVVDEFQNLFLEDDPISRESALILERLTREGRSFGIHILLGSQSLAGKASNLSSATLGQIGIRIALMCNESDARAIMADDNPEARLLSRPGEAIYNNRNGLIEGNKRFQVALFGDEARQKYLNLIFERTKTGQFSRPVVFEGNQLAKLEDCEIFEKILTGKVTKPKKVQAWIGDPIKLSNEPTLVNLRRQVGNNLLIVAREEAEGVGMLTSTWAGLALQHKPEDVDFYFFNFSNSEEQWFEVINDFGEMLQHNVKRLDRRNLLDSFITLNQEIEARVENGTSHQKNAYIFIFGLQRAKDLRFEDNRFGYSSGPKEPSPSELFSKIIKEGPEVGIHVLVWCDLVNNVKRTFDRKTMNEFNFRIATQMSQDDSQFLLDSSVASKLDRPQRAILYDEDRPGYLDKFRPFSIPSEKSWWEDLVSKLNRFHGEN